MTEEISAAPARAPVKAGAWALLATPAAVAVAPVTSSREGEKHVAYKDFARGVWTICDGHTGPDVQAGLTATTAQCKIWLRQDLTAKAKAVLQCSPGLAAHVDALKAATDFAFNVGEGRYCHSTIAVRFNAGDIAGGCEAFLPWDKAKVNGQLVEVPGLKTRRE
jgi:lysozyme